MGISREINADPNPPHHHCDPVPVGVRVDPTQILMAYPNPYSLELYENLPVYARLADENEILRHVVAPLQRPFSTVDHKLKQLPYNLNPSHPSSSEFLDFVGQWVGLAVVGGKWLGYGLNPDWTDDEKRRCLLRAWKYWQMKGTEWAIREAIYMWLGWEPTHDRDHHQIILPFGQRPTSTPPNWWGYDTPYDAHLLQDYPHRQHLGSGDYCPGVTYEPDWFGLRFPTWKWDYADVWVDTLELETVRPGVVERSTSHLGPNRPWQHFNIYTDDEWLQIFPNIFQLTPEIWASQAIPTIFGWWNAPLPTLILLENRDLPRTETVIEFDVDGVHYGDFYPYASRPATTEVRQIPETIEFAIAGCDYTDWWAGLGGRWIEGSDRLESVHRDGIYPGCEYETDWYGSMFAPIDQPVAIAHDGNFLNYTDLNWEWQTWFYYAPGDTWIETQVVPDPIGGLPPWYLGEWDGSVLIPGTDAIADPYPGEWWHVPNHWIEVIRDEIIQIPAVPCTPGMEIDIVTGYHEWQKLVERVPANQLIAYSPESLLVDAYVPQPPAAVGLEWADWWWMLDGAAYTDPLRSPADSYDARWWQATYPRPPLAVTCQPEHWIWEQPVAIANYYSSYSETLQWYSMGAPQRYEPVTMPVLERVQLCNVFNNWTMKQIIYWHEYQVLVPEDELNYSLTDIYPMLQHLINGNDWQLFLECNAQLVLLTPVTLVWTQPNNMDMRASYYSLEQGFTHLLIEFAMQPTAPDIVRSLKLQVDSVVIYQQTVRDLPIHPMGQVGFRFFLPTQPEVSPFAPDGNLQDILILGSEAPDPLNLANLYARNPEPVSFIREYILDNGTRRTINGMGQTTFTIEVGLPKSEFEVGQVTTVAPTFAEIPIQTRILDSERGIVEFSAWGAPIADRSVRVLVMVRRHQSPEFLMSLMLMGGQSITLPNGLTQTRFLIDTGLGHPRFGVGTIRSVGGMQDEIRDRRVVVLDTGHIEVIFWGDAPMLDNTLQLFIYSVDPLPIGVIDV